VGSWVGTVTVWNPLRGSTSSAGGGAAGCRCACVSSTTDVSMRTTVSAGRAESVAYTAAAMTTAWSVSDVAPTPSSVLVLVRRFVSYSLNSIRPPVSLVRLRRRPHPHDPVGRREVPVRSFAARTRTGPGPTPDAPTRLDG